MIHALIFDFDGLILDTETPLIDAYGELHAMHGVPFDRTAFIHSVGHSDYAFDPWHGFALHADRAALELERSARSRARTRAQPVLPGVVALLDAARLAGLRLAIASNSGHPHVEDHLRRLGLHDRFEFFACREDVVSPKPAPDLYHLVLHRFGLLGQNALAFEDSHTGSLAAKRANLRCVAVPNPSTAHHDFSPVDLILPSLADTTLPALLQKFLLP